MDNFTVIYKILKTLEQAMDYDEFDVKQISHTRLNISYQRWEKILIMLAKSGYIEGILYDQCSGDYCPHIEEPIAPCMLSKMFLDQTWASTIMRLISFRSLVLK